MMKNYFKVAWRSLLKYKVFSSINIFGLATGMACSLLIFLFVKDELSYDRYHKDADRIYRVVKDFINDDGSRIPDATSPAWVFGAASFSPLLITLITVSFHAIKSALANPVKSLRTE